MRFMTEGVGDIVHTLRLVTPGQWLLRGLCAASLVGAALLCLTWFPMALEAPLLIAVAFAGAWTIGRPESVAPLAAIAVLGFWWMSAGGASNWGQTAALAGLLACFHLTAALGAAAPTYAEMTPRAAGALLRRGVGYLAASAGAALLVIGVSSVPPGVLPRGLGWIGVGFAVVVLATGAVLAGLSTLEPRSAEDRRRRRR
ncbi:MAG: hypothetical protein QM713_10860 [Arachnia sp.]